METRKANATGRPATAARGAAALSASPREASIHPDPPAAGEEQESASVARVGYAPIVRVDAAQREIELCATSEALDSYGTVFDYAASKDAFTRWIGNVREMHERRAVGSRIGVRCDDEQRKVYVRVRISRGAADTWEKVLDGTLRGASIGASNVVWERQTRRVAGRARLLNVATRYDLVELSLVDSPSNPDALGITIMRDAVPDIALLDDLTASPALDLDIVEPPPAAPSVTNAAGAPPAVPDATPPVEVLPAAPAPPPDDSFGSRAYHNSACPPNTPSGDSATRAQGPFSTNAQGYPDAGVPAQAEARPTSALGLHEDGNARERFHAAARGILMGCGCPLCEGALAALGETGPAGDGNTRVLRGGGSAGELRESALARALASGLSASVTRMERVDESVRGLGNILQTAVSQIEGASGDLRRRIEALEAQPLPGGPAAFAFDKSLALAPGGSGSGTRSQPGAAEQRRALESLAGKLTDPQAQIAVAAELIRLQRGE